MENLLKSEWIKVVIFIFGLGMFYNKVENQAMRIDTIEQRLEKKIKVINNLEDRLRKQETCQ
jgi:hypothetical protein